MGCSSIHAKPSTCCQRSSQFCNTINHNCSMTASLYFLGMSAEENDLQVSNMIQKHFTIEHSESQLINLHRPTAATTPPSPPKLVHRPAQEGDEKACVDQAACQQHGWRH